MPQKRECPGNSFRATDGNGRHYFLQETIVEQAYGSIGESGVDWIPVQRIVPTMNGQLLVEIDPGVYQVPTTGMILRSNDANSG